jgi:hypothetical protein
MEYRLNLYTDNPDFFEIAISFTDLDNTDYDIRLHTLRNENGAKIRDKRRNAYQLMLTSPVPLDQESMKRIYNEIKRTVKKVFEITPRYIDIVSESQYDNTQFSDCFERFGRNILCSEYPNNDIQDITTDLVETSEIKRLNYDGQIVKLNPKQEVFRISDIIHKDTFPSVHCALKDGYMNILENTLDHKRNEHTVFTISDDYIALSPHVGYIQTYDDLFVWFVSTHVLVPNLAERRKHFDPEIKCMTKINTANLLERFQEVLKALNFITISTVYNRCIYSYESRTLVFIGDFPGDVVTIDIKEKYLACIHHEPTTSN